MYPGNLCTVANSKTQPLQPTAMDGWVRRTKHWETIFSLRQLTSLHPSPHPSPLTSNTPPPRLFSTHYSRTLLLPFYQTSSGYLTHTCTIFRSRMDELFRTLMVAVAMARVCCVRAGGTCEWRGGPSYNKMA